MRNNIIETAARDVRWVIFYWKSGDWKRRLAMLMPLVLIFIFSVLPEIGLSDKATRGIAICIMWVMVGPWFFSKIGR
jgi:hypothetical protein